MLYYYNHNTGDAKEALTEKIKYNNQLQAKILL